MSAGAVAGGALGMIASGVGQGVKFFMKKKKGLYNAPKQGYSMGDSWAGYKELKSANDSAAAEAQGRRASVDDRAAARLEAGPVKAERVERKVGGMSGARRG